MWIPTSKFSAARLLVGGISLATAGGAYAAEPRDTPEVATGVTAIAQHASDPRVDNSGTASVDIVITVPYGDDHIEVYIEGNTSPGRSGVASRLGEANADAGTALGADEEGRVQISGLSYGAILPWDAVLDIGLIDPSAYLDHSYTANDENNQFLGRSFVNNLAIEFPDYTLGLGYRQRPPTGLGVHAVITSSDGLADNPKASYGQLLNVDEPDKGVFAGAEAEWLTGEQRFTLGAWTHTAPHDSLDGNETGLRNYGVFAVAGHMGSNHAVDLRLGAANPDVFRAHYFAAVSCQLDFGAATGGVGWAHAWHSRIADAETEGDFTQVEAYLRFAATPHYSLSPSVQYLVNSGFDASGTEYGKRIMILGLRLHATY